RAGREPRGQRPVLRRKQVTANAGTIGAAGGQEQPRGGAGGPASRMAARGVEERHESFLARHTAQVERAPEVRTCRWATGRQPLREPAKRRAGGGAKSGCGREW